MKKQFKVICSTCEKEFYVEEDENKFPKKKKYYCSRSCANKRQHSDETKHKISMGVKKSEKFIDDVHRKFGTIEDRRKKTTSICMVCGKKFEQKTYVYNGRIKFQKCKICSKECRSKYFSIKNKNCTGGFRESSVKNYKSGWYNGIHCDSSWELAFIIYCTEHNMDIKRCKQVREYLDKDGIKRKFHPDFIVDGVVYEIKGKQDRNLEEKRNSNQDVIFIYKSDMKPYLDYVIEKYGTDFIKKYDSKDKYKICPVCGKKFENRKTTYCSIRCARIDCKK